MNDGSLEDFQGYDHVEALDLVHDVQQPPVFSDSVLVKMMAMEMGMEEVMGMGMGMGRGMGMVQGQGWGWIPYG